MACPISSIQRELTDIVLRLSRDMDADSPCGPLFQITKPIHERLQVVDLHVVGEVRLRVDLSECRDRGEATSETS